jgi:hypothetical protein
VLSEARLRFAVGEGLGKEMSDHLARLLWQLLRLKGMRSQGLRVKIDLPGRPSPFAIAEPTSTRLLASIGGTRQSW